MNGSSDEEYKETLLLFALFRRNKRRMRQRKFWTRRIFAQRQQRGSFRLLLQPHLCTIWCSPAKERKQTHRLDQLLVFKNGLHLSKFIGAKLYKNYNIYATFNYLTFDRKPRGMKRLLQSDWTDAHLPRVYGSCCVNNNCRYKRYAVINYNSKSSWVFLSPSGPG